MKEDGFVHYGSLEGQVEGVGEEAREEASGRDGSGGVIEVTGGGNEGNVDDGDDDDDNADRRMDLGSATLREQELHAAALRSVEMKRRAREMAVATDDSQVRAQLREMGQPITLFGEREGERRERLRLLLAEKSFDAEELEALEARAKEAAGAFKRQRKENSEIARSGGTKEDEAPSELHAAAKKAKETVYSHASAELIEARRNIAKLSWENAKARLEREKANQANPNAYLHYQDGILKKEEDIRAITISGSQVGDTRPLSCCSISSRKDMLATGSFSGVAKVWNAETFEACTVLKGHDDRLVSLKFNPKNGSVLVTGSADKTAKLWQIPDVAASSSDMEVEKKIETQNISASSTLKGHALRLSSVAWHPSGDFIGSSSYDHTWRLWDAQVSKELLLQDGHEFPVYGFAFHPDGSLACSGDLAGVARLWDLRSGQCITSLLGHATGVLSVDFSVDGIHLATGSLDHTARVWDLRKRKTLHTIPGHVSLVSGVCFDPNDGSILATSSYDHTSKLWSTRSGSLLHELSSHDHLVTDVCMTADHLLTCSFDRTWKLYNRVAQ